MVNDYPDYVQVTHRSDPIGTALWTSSSGNLTIDGSQFALDQANIVLRLLYGKCGTSYYSTLVNKLWFELVPPHEEEEEKERPGLVDVAKEIVVQEIAEIRAAFDLNTSELARLVGATRQCVYDWILKKHFPEPDKRERLSRIREAAKYWNLRSTVPMGKLAKEKGPQGNTFLNLLADREAEWSAIKQTLDFLAEKAAVAEKRSRKDDLTERTKSANLPLPKDRNSPEVDVITGRPLDDE